MTPSTPSKPKSAASLSGRPSTRSLMRWGTLVVVVHLGVLLSLAGTLDWQLSRPQTLRTGPMQIRTLTDTAATSQSGRTLAPPAARTRVALVEKAITKPILGPSPEDPEMEVGPDQSPSMASGASVHTLPSDSVEIADSTQARMVPGLDTGPEAATAPQDSETLVSETPRPVELVETHTPATSPSTSTSTSTSLPQAPGTDAPERIASATQALPELALASLPGSALLSYRLHGQEKGIQYQASGELRWQRNNSAYSMGLSVRAFLLGSRHWRSVGQINASGLAPTRFSDSWRSERAAHFDRPNQRIVFSNNAPTTPLLPGAQDQVSLYAQLAAAMAQSGQKMPPGTRLQIQTATVRDALPWLLTLEKLETLQMDGKSLETVKWVCQPRNRFDAQVEFWVSSAHDWLPARIRITQASGNFIDLQLTGRETLPDLPSAQ